MVYRDIGVVIDKILKILEKEDAKSGNDTNLSALRGELEKLSTDAKYTAPEIAKDFWVSLEKNT